MRAVNLKCSALCLLLMASFDGGHLAADVVIANKDPRVVVVDFSGNSIRYLDNFDDTRSILQEILLRKLDRQNIQSFYRQNYLMYADTPHGDMKLFQAGCELSIKGVKFDARKEGDSRVRLNISNLNIFEFEVCGAGVFGDPSVVDVKQGGPFPDCLKIFPEGEIARFECPVFSEEERASAEARAALAKAGADTVVLKGFYLGMSKRDFEVNYFAQGFLYDLFCGSSLGNLVSASRFRLTRVGNRTGHPDKRFCDIQSEFDGNKNLKYLAVDANQLFKIADKNIHDMARLFERAYEIKLTLKTSMRVDSDLFGNSTTKFHHRYEHKSANGYSVVIDGDSLKDDGNCGRILLKLSQIEKEADKLKSFD